MRIISKFRDYYDSVQAHGVDLTLVFHRKTLRYGLDEGGNTLHRLYSEMQGEEFDGSISTEQPGMQPFWEPHKVVKFWVRNFASTEGRFEYHVEEMMVGFCGKIQPCIKFTYGSRAYLDPTLATKDTRVDYVYTLEQADKAVSNFPKSLQKRYYGKKKTKKERRRRPDRDGAIYGLDRDEFEQFFKIHQPVEDARLFLHFKAPIVTLRRSDDVPNSLAIHVNDELNKVGYMKVSDPFMAYQEIAQYISGVLGVGEPETVDISNEDMRDKKGFFDMSFKKDPGVKKPRRRGKKRG